LDLRWRRQNRVDKAERAEREQAFEQKWGVKYNAHMCWCPGSVQWPGDQCGGFVVCVGLWWSSHFGPLSRGPKCELHHSPTHTTNPPH
jgi:hypothetical protein